MFSQAEIISEKFHSPCHLKGFGNTDRPQSLSLTCTCKAKKVSVSHVLSSQMFLPHCFRVSIYLVRLRKSWSCRKDELQPCLLAMFKIHPIHL